MTYQPTGYEQHQQQQQQQQQDVVSGEQYRYALTNFVSPISLSSKVVQVTT